MTVEISDDAASLASAAARRLSDCLAEIQSRGTTPSLVLTGGTIANAVYEAIDGTLVDWSHVDIYWGDERFVPAEGADRNERQAREAFLSRLGVPDSHVHAMPSSDSGLTAAEAADAYAGELPEAPFDLMLLGMGPDGHVASLFPGFAQLHESSRRVVEVFDSPKPPPVRLSLTFPALNNATRVWFLVSGEPKAEAVGRAHGPGTVEDTPATGVRGQRQTLWLLDRGAASAL